MFVCFVVMFIFFVTFIEVAIYLACFSATNLSCSVYRRHLNIENYAIKDTGNCLT